MPDPDLADGLHPQRHVGPRHLRGGCAGHDGAPSRQPLRPPRASRASHRSSQRISASTFKISASCRSTAASSVCSSSASLLAGVALQQAHQCPALALEQPADVDLRCTEGQQRLDRQLIARRGVDDHGGVEPLLEMVTTRRGQAVGPAGAVADPVRLDEAVAVEALKGRVDLPDVDRPGVAGPIFEVGLQRVAVPCVLGEQRQQPVAHRHLVLQSSSQNGFSVPTAPTGARKGTAGHRCRRPASRGAQSHEDRLVDDQRTPVRLRADGYPRTRASTATDHAGSPHCSAPSRASTVTAAPVPP